MESSNQDNWQVTEVSSGGVVTLIRVRRLQPNRLQPSKIRVMWEYRGTKGMPSQLDLERMTSLEENLETICKKCGNAVLLYVITGSGIRQWVLHCENVSEFNSWLNAVLPHSPPFPIELEFAEDKNWEEYKEMQEICGIE